MRASKDTSTPGVKCQVSYTQTYRGFVDFLYTIDYDVFDTLPLG